MSYLEQLEQELQPQIDKILNHPFVCRIRDSWLSREQLRYFAEQYYVYCRYFPRFLAAAASNVPDDATRIALIENLWEEHGEGSLEESHRILYETFAQSLDLSSSDLQAVEPLPTTEICIENMMDICRNQHFLIALGALGPGTEYFTNDEYGIIAQGLKQYDFMTDDALRFWTVHIHLDEDHYADMMKAVLPWAHDEANQKMLRKGAYKALALEYMFWEGLEDNLPNK